ncbi:hypothetical protein CYLTODRAFT_212527 [Cylindrobasidium torrendii FP15055 ss-10]|uniref:BTB domain-containing protein n=1 Tax=Cylindrobasidium torrendii FP15055 ss-10 TaxID=1314674 RepID=A0A0D7BGT0_9AGAR|nr:hypothetical protein CYLTODRAFT_212527 [Cylindrobasidium torrendii FP15055 ss-10]
MSVKSSKIGDLKRSSDFFLRGGDLFFLVGDVYYKVNSVFFERESPIFAALVKNWDIPDAQAKGASLSTALILENVSVTQFERFLWVFYNRQFSPYDAPLDAWKDILDLAHRWEFGEVKKLAVRQLHSIRGIHPVDRIVLYKDYDVDEEYIIPLYAKLIVRDEPLSQRESQKLGVDTTVLIFQARERLRTQEQDGLKSPLPTDVNDAEVMRVVAQLFGSDNASEEDSFAEQAHDRIKKVVETSKVHPLYANIGSRPGRKGARLY